MIELIYRRGFSITRHFREVLQKRGLTLSDVVRVFKNGTAEIIQGHAPGTYAITGGALNEDEIRVVYGVTESGTVIHVVVGIEGGGRKFKFITVYYPSKNYFEDDLKTLRPEFRNRTFIRFSDREGR